MNLHDLLAVPRRRAPHRTALHVRTGGEAVVLSYQDLFAAADRAAAAWAARGLGRGDRVALHLGNRPETVVAYLAALRLGAVAVPVNLAYRAREIGHILADAEPRLLVTGGEQRAHLEGVDRHQCSSLDAVLDAGELALWPRGGDAPDPPPDPSPAPPVRGSDLALLLYTSGTTGKSKGAEIRHDNLLATITGLLAAWGWSADDRLLLTLPLFHTHGLVVGLLTALCAGATVLLEPRFDAVAVASALTGDGPPDRPSPTLFFGVPTLYVRLVDELGRRRQESRPCRTPAVRLYASGSAPLAAETFEAFHQLTGHEILERYGMTETGMNLSNLYAGPRRPGTVGVPLPGVSMRIVDDAGRGVEDGGEGELLVAGANVFRGYWRDAEKTAAAFVGDGEPDPGDEAPARPDRRWFRTGDLARRDPRTGAVTLLGRRHELVITGGYNVYPREVEEVLLAVPGIREAAVAGLPDRDKGEVVAAWLVAGDGPAPDEEEIERHLRQRLAPFKVPRRLLFVDELPRNALGKVLKHRLPAP